MAVGADAGVGIGDHLAVFVGRGPDRLGDIFQIHLVADAGSGRYDLEIVKRLRSPFQKFVALHIALIFQLDIMFERLGRAEFVDHHRVVDDQMHGHLRVDLLGIAAERLDAVAHRREIDHRRHAGKILHQYAGRAILNLRRAFRFLLPVNHRLRILGGNGKAVILEAQHIFQQHFQRVGQLVDIAELLRRLGERIIGVIGAIDGERRAGAEGVFAGGGHGGGCPFVYILSKPTQRGVPGRLRAVAGVGFGCSGGL